MLEIAGIRKRFGDGDPVLSDINLDVDSGEIICLLGPSGCGKTTLLRIVAGLEKADHGQIHYRSRDLAEVPVHQRNFGFMFQDFALFPHHTVKENIAFGLNMAKWPSDQIQIRVDEMMALTGLPDAYAQRTIFELSGGEQQRVALARSLAPGPELLMLDEPLGNLDRALRETLMLDLRTILKRLRVTAIYVTHDQAEAYAVADRIVLMRGSRIVQIGQPQAIYLQPGSPEIARFLGFENILRAEVEDVLSKRVKTTIGSLSLTRLPQSLEIGDACWLLIYPQALTIAEEDSVSVPHFEAIVESTSFRGDHYEVTVVLPNEASEDLRLQCEIPTSVIHQQRNHGSLFSLEPAQTVHLALDVTQTTVLGGDEIV